MGRGKIRLDGFTEASRQLGDMKRSMAQGVGRRSLQVPAGILAEEITNRAPELTGDLKQSVKVGKERAQRGRPQVNVTVADIASVQVEFGNHHQQAEPYARPAEEATRGRRLFAFGEVLKGEIDRTVIRQARRAAKSIG